MVLQLPVEIVENRGGGFGQPGPCGGPSRLDLFALAGGEEGQLLDRRVGMGRHRREQRLEMEEQAPGGRAPEEAGPVFHLEPDALGPLHDPVGELEGGAGADRIERLDRQLAARRGLHEGLLEKKMGLEERLGHAARAGLQVLQDPLERSLVVGEGAEQPVALAQEEFAESRLPGNVGTEQDQVGENADHRLQLGPVAVRRSRADHEPRLPGVAVEQDDVGAEENHEESDAPLAA